MSLMCFFFFDLLQLSVTHMLVSAGVQKAAISQTDMASLVRRLPERKLICMRGYACMTTWIQ